MVQIVAHRGSSGDRPENTLPAFAEAVRVKADIIELDVHLSKDGHLIVMHDETVDRTTNGKGRICDKTLTELKRIECRQLVLRRLCRHKSADVEGSPRSFSSKRIIVVF